MAQVVNIKIREYSDGEYQSSVEAHLHDDGYMFLFHHDKTPRRDDSGLIMLRPDEVKKLLDAVRESGVFDVN